MIDGFPVCGSRYAHHLDYRYYVVQHEIDVFLWKMEKLHSDMKIYMNLMMKDILSLY